MANQLRLGNWSIEENNPVDDARSLSYMMGINAADNRASSLSSSPPRRINELNLNMIPTFDNGGWTHLSSIRERDNNSFSSSYPTIGGQTGVGPASPAAKNNVSDVRSMFPFGGGVNTTTTTTTAAGTTGRRWWNQTILNEIVDVGGSGVNTTNTTAAATTGRRWWNQPILNEGVDVGGGGGVNTTTAAGRRWWNQPIQNEGVDVGGGGVNTTTTIVDAATTGRRWWNQSILNEIVDVGGSGVNTTTTTAVAATGRRWWNQPILNEGVDVGGGGVNTTTTADAGAGRRWWNQPIRNEGVDVGGGGVNTTTTIVDVATTGRRWWNQLNEIVDVGGSGVNTTTTTTAAAATDRRWWNQPILNEGVDVGGGGVNTTTAAAATGRRWWNQPIRNEGVDVGGDGVNTTTTTVDDATTGRRWWNQPILNEDVDVSGGGVNTTTGRRWWNQHILNEGVDVGGGGVNTTIAATTTGRRWWNQPIFNEVEDGGPTSFLAPTTVPRRPGSFVPPPPPSSPSLSDYLPNPHPPQSEQYMQTDSTLASSENRARSGDNNGFFISGSEIRSETDRLMDEIQSTLEHLRNGGSIRSEDVMILDFLVTLNPLIDSEDWTNQIMMALEDHVSWVERGLTEEEILRSIHEETYQFNPNETSTQNQACTICQEDFVDGESIGRLDCIHVYHLHCITQWLELRNACPICKKRAMEIDEDEDGN